MNTALPRQNHGCVWGFARTVLLAAAFVAYLAVPEVQGPVYRVLYAGMALALACLFIAFLADVLRRWFHADDERACQQPEADEWVGWGECPAHGPYGPVRVPPVSSPSHA